MNFRGTKIISEYSNIYQCILHIKWIQKCILCIWKYKNFIYKICSYYNYICIRVYKVINCYILSGQLLLKFYLYDFHSLQSLWVSIKIWGESRLFLYLLIMNLAFSKNKSRKEFSQHVSLKQMSELHRWLSFMH